MSENKNIFEELKQIRLEKKITLKQISQSTKIHQKYLESLEKGNLQEIPEIYDKLFFKSYIKALEISEEDFYDKFLEYRSTIREDRTAILDMTQTESAIEAEFNYKNILYFVPIIVAVLIIWFLISNTLTVSNGNEPVQEVSIRDVAATIQSKIDSMKKIEEKMHEDSIIVNRNSILNLKINALEETWFRVVADKKDTNEYLLQKGQTVSIGSTKSFEFLIGKASGLEFSFKGKIYGPFGKENQVIKYMLIDSSGVASKIIGYPTNKQKETDEQENQI